MHNLQLSSSYYITFICILHIAQQVQKIFKKVELLINQLLKVATLRKHIRYLDIFCKKLFTFLVWCYSQLKQLFSEKLPITLSRDFCIFANTPYTSRLMRKKIMLRTSSIVQIPEIQLFYLKYCKIYFLMSNDDAGIILLHICEKKNH